MNTHFLSFLFDMGLWTCGAIYVSRSLSFLQGDTMLESLKRMSLNVLFALITGFFITLTDGLPETGIALKQLLGVFLLLGVLLIAQSPLVRNSVQLFIHNILRGGEHYGNNSQYTANN